MTDAAPNEWTAHHRLLRTVRREAHVTLTCGHGMTIDSRFNTRPGTSVHCPQCHGRSWIATEVKL